MSNTRLAWLPLTVRRPGPGPGDRRGRLIRKRELTGGERDHLRHAEGARVERDRVGGGERIGEIDRLAQAELAGARPDAVGWDIDGKRCALRLKVPRSIAVARAKPRSSVAGTPAPEAPAPMAGLSGKTPGSRAARHSRPGGPV